MEVNLEVIINKLEYKVNELTLRNAKLKKLGVIKDRLEATYRCELRKELLRLSINSTKISIIDDIEGDNANLTQLRLNRDLAEIRYYSMKSSIENIKFEIEVLRSLLIWLSDELEYLRLNVKRKSWLN